MAIITDIAPSKQARELYRKGASALEKGNIDYAIDLLYGVVQQSPAFREARKLLREAEVTKVRRSGKGGLSSKLSAVSGMPTYMRAMAQLKADKHEEALESCEKLLRQDPLSPKFGKLFAQVASAAEMPESGIDTLEMVRDAFPEDISVINWLGTLYLKVGRTRSARACFEKLCEIAPNDLTALKSLKDAMAIDSMSSDGWQAAAENKGSYQDLVKDSKEAQLLEQDAKAVKTDQDADDLIEATKIKIEKEPGNVNYYRQLGRLYAQKHDYDDAIGAIQQAKALNPGDPEIEATLTETRVQQFNYEIEQLNGAGQTDVAAAKAQERDQFVFDDLQDRVQRYPNDLGLRHQLGVILYDNDYINEAIQQFQLAQRNPSTRSQALFYLAMCFKSKSQFDMAIEQLSKANSELVAMDDTKKKVYYELGVISELMGEPKRAADYYKEIYQVDIGYRDIAEKIEQVYQSAS